MSSVLRPVRKRKKVRTLGPVDVIDRKEYAELDVDTKVELIRSLVPLGLLHVEELLDEEVTALAVFSRREDLDRTRGPARRGEHCHAVPEGRLAPNLYYRWSKEFLEAGKKRLVGDTSREATAPEVTDLRKENSRLKQLVAEVVLENRLLKKNVTGSDSGDDTCD